ncbi:hypothetical protein F4861DRAFT_358854 [Xylaria intraflava]|nr:hypothetical protein F4861DRAFT_358854 [Xylaria intraflava]
MTQSKFRAIIIGGGPVGLVIANGLDRAGLDYLVVERNPTMLSESGAGIMLWPHSTRIFDQLGIVENCEGRYIPLHGKVCTRLNGTELRSGSSFDTLAENHGYPAINFPRPLLIQTLLEGLGGNSHKVRTGVSIEDIEMNKRGVRVRLSDGSVEEGSIVVGADGVHSNTRTIMQKLAKEAGQDFAAEEDSITASYQIMFGRAKKVPGVATGTFYESHGTYRSTQISADEKRMHFGIYRKLPKTTTTLKKDYSKAEVAEFVNAFSDVMVTPTLSFPELYENCEWTRLVNQHEGLSKHWCFGRVVLAGDSCAQMTAAVGMGLNNGIQSAVALVNKIHDVVSADADPDTETLGRAFAEYQDVRREESRAICDLAAQVIRVNTWDSYMKWFVGDVVFPWMMSDAKMLGKMGVDVVRGMRKFDFIESESKMGKIPWVN